MFSYCLYAWIDINPCLRVRWEPAKAVLPRQLERLHTVKKYPGQFALPMSLGVVTVVAGGEDRMKEPIEVIRLS